MKKVIVKTKIDNSASTDWKDRGGSARSGAGAIAPNPASRDKQTRDNRITNRLVREGKLPKSRAEIYNNPNPNQSFKNKD